MKLYTLLKKYIEEKINKDEFIDLKQKLNATSDIQLESVFSDLWLETSIRTMNEDIKQDVKNNLNQYTHIKKKRIFNWRRIAVAILFPTICLAASYTFITLNRSSVQEYIVMADKGQKTQIYLPDGTKVWLNSDSHIIYNSEYNQNNRQVKLIGEAFFEVEKNENSQFIVNAEGVSIVVHGTAFNVSAYEIDSVLSVSLNRGKVHIENNLNRSVIANLRPNQQILIKKNDLSSRILSCDAAIESLWTLNKLRLDDVSSQELFRKMEHWYGVNINVENINRNNKYALTIKTESLREMLDLINKLTPIKYSINGEEVNIRYGK